MVSGNSFMTINNALHQNIKPSSLKNAIDPRAVHRLDYPTTGLLVIGKTSESVLKLNKQFAEKKVEKQYLATTIGKMSSQGEINSLIDDKQALTTYKTIETVRSNRFEFLNLVVLSPKTGRRHQLRKHLAAIGNPILGDKEYAIEGLALKGKGLYLHALAIKFAHPITGKNLCIKSLMPIRFLKLFESIEF